MQHDGKVPTSFADKREFRARLHALERPSLEGIEDNIAEAASNAPLAFFATGADAIQPDLQEVLDDEAAKHLTATTSPFWFLVAAVRDFVTAHGSLPLSGERCISCGAIASLPSTHLPRRHSPCAHCCICCCVVVGCGAAGELPDMTATTELYIALQRVYAAQAEADRAAVATRVRELEASVGEPCGHLVDGDCLLDGTGAWHSSMPHRHDYPCRRRRGVDRH